MSENPGMVHTERKFIVIYGLVKLENKLYTYRIEYIVGMVIGLTFSFQKYRSRRKRGLKSQASPKTSRANSISYQGLKIILDRRLL